MTLDKSFEVIGWGKDVCCEFGWGKDVHCEFIQSGFGFLMAVCPVAIALNSYALQVGWGMQLT